MAEFPINPALQDGRLVHLVDIVGKPNAFPVPRPAVEVDDAGKPVWDTETKSRVRSAEVYARLGIGPAFSAHTTVNHSMMVLETQVGLWAFSEDPGAIVIKTFWGIGLRMALTFTAFEGAADLNIGLLAAHVETSGMRVSYQIESIGLGRKELAGVLREFPVLGKFDIDAHNKLYSVRTKLVAGLIAQLQTPAAAELLQPTIVDLSTAPIADTLQEAAERRFVMQSIAAKLSLQDTLARIGKNGRWTKVRRAEVQKLYLAHTGGASSPTPAHVSEASNWLQF